MAQVMEGNWIGAWSERGGDGACSWAQLLCLRVGAVWGAHKCGLTSGRAGLTLAGDVGADLIGTFLPQATVALVAADPVVGGSGQHREDVGQDAEQSAPTLKAPLHPHAAEAAAKDSTGRIGHTPEAPHLGMSLAPSIPFWGPYSRELEGPLPSDPPCPRSSLSNSAGGPTAPSPQTLSPPRPGLPTRDFETSPWRPLRPSPQGSQLCSRTQLPRSLPPHVECPLNQPSVLPTQVTHTQLPGAS